jgi:hypothetical protein
MRQLQLTARRQPATRRVHGRPRHYTRMDSQTHIDHARTVMRGYGARRDIIDVHMRETRKTCGHLLHPQIRTALERGPSRRRPYLKLEAGAPRVHDPSPQFTRAKPKQRWGLHKAIEGFQIWAGPQIGVGWRPNLGTEAPKIWAQKCQNFGSQIWAQKRPKKRPRGGGLAGGGGCV